MTDIVERLRHMAKLLGFDLLPLLSEAADERSSGCVLRSSYGNGASMKLPTCWKSKTPNTP